jgi:hypothetical protein
VDGSTKRTEPVDVRKLRRARCEVDGELLLPGHWRARHHEVQVGPPPLGVLERVEQHVEALPRVDAPDRAHQRGVVRDPDAVAEPPGQLGSELGRVDRLVHDLDVRRVELVGDRLRHADDLHREVPGKETLEL